jgi:hypothetical protein
MNIGPSCAVMTNWFAKYGAAAGPRGNTGFVARLFAPRWSLLRLDAVLPETIVSRHGVVEIRETDAGLSVQTCVKGEPDRARATALQRITDYLAGSDRIGIKLRAVGPLVQREEASGRWLVRVGLPSVDDACVAAHSRNGKVRIRPVQSEVLAVLRMSGRLAPEAIARADAAIRAALAGTVWTPTDRPMIRLYRPPSMAPFANRFEVAVPIARRRRDAQSHREACGGAIRQLPAMEHPTQES